ncbi:MAG: tetratricopeptide repeat protein [Bacteroidia bacterium]
MSKHNPLKTYAVKACLMACLMLFFYSSSLAAKGKKVVDPRLDSLRTALHQPQKVNVKMMLISKISLQYMSAGYMDSARYWLTEGIRLTDSVHDEKKTASLQMNMGNSYMFQGLFPKALEHYLKNVAIRERLKDSVALANSYNALGIVYFRMNENVKAEEYWNKALALCNKFHKEDLAMNTYCNLAMVYEANKDTNKAEAYTLRALEIAKRIKDTPKVITIAANMGQLYVEKKQYQKALEYLNMAAENGGNEANGGRGNPSLDGALGEVYYAMKEYPKALSYTKKAVTLAGDMEDYFMLTQLNLELSLIYEAMKNYPEAYAAHKLYAQYNDSVYSKKNVEKMSDLRSQYEVEKKEAELKQAEHVQELSRQVEAHKQKLFDLALLTGLAMSGILALILYRSYRIKKRSNNLIMEQKREIEGKNHELEQVNKEVNDSIQYAQRIQQAILPPAELIRESLPDSFVYYQPKNVVSGDFYFFHKIKTGEVILAACDCTGHGVPGAFMSMIGSEQISKIVIEKGITEPSRILDELHAGLRKALQQDRNSSRDGMDAAFCKVNLGLARLEFAGANRPCWIVKAGTNELLEIKPDKQAIGGLESELRKAFSAQTYAFSKGDKIYLFSDGYADQFGGEKGKKFMLRNFQKLVLSICHLSMREQELALKAAYTEWKSNLEQVDDILVIGFQL